ncbi:MAG: hypothetical protein WCF85_21470 [Rhodospirillaceae bacterium]
MVELSKIHARFLEYLKTPDLSLSSKTRRFLFLRLLDAFEEGLAAGRFTHNGKMVTTVPNMIPDDDSAPRKRQKRVPVVEVKKNRKVKPGKV